ncbi:MAG: D-Ala-D-Ala carboxypeptidase family metallohydrolase [Pseudomonadota bacterium]
MPKAAVIALLALLAACNAESPQPGLPEARYEAWLAAGHRAEVQAYANQLRTESVGDVMPMAALSRTSRRWRLCRHGEFATPPEDLWKNMPPTLRVVARLRDAGILDPALARSVYRDEAVNRCAGGSARSKHRENRAIDFDLASSPENVARLCAFWREHGPALDLGLGFYTPTAIHLDTAG